MVRWENFAFAAAPVAMMEDAVAFDGAQEREKLVPEKPQEKEPTSDPEFDSEKETKTDLIYYNKLKPDQKSKFTLPNEVSNYRIRITAYDNNGNYGVFNKSIKSIRAFNMFIDEPLYILNNEMFPLKFVIENNT